tara:strand:- start:243 stop:503 length:261 start_codon:yes stop_codon:yes gene_type:complete
MIKNKDIKSMKALHIGSVSGSLINYYSKEERTVKELAETLIDFHKLDELKETAEKYAVFSDGKEEMVALETWENKQWNKIITLDYR